MWFSPTKITGAGPRLDKLTDPVKQQKLLNEANEAAAADGAYVPLANQNNYFIYGSKVGGFLPTVAASYYPDLGGMYVKK